jgi:hypothetical protein
MGDNFNERVKELIKRSGSVKEAARITGLSYLNILRLSGYPINGCEMIYDTLHSVWTDMESKKSLHTNVNGYDIDMDYMRGSLIWSRTKMSDVYSFYATPYWDGNCTIPITVDYLKIHGLDNRMFWLEGDGDNIDEIPAQEYFNNIDELITYFNDVYVPTVYFTIESYLKKTKKNLLD